MRPARINFRRAVLVTAASLCIAAPAQGESESASREERIRSAFEEIARPDARESERRGAVGQLKKAARRNTTDAAAIVGEYLGSIHIYEQLALPRAFKVLDEAGVAELLRVYRTATDMRTRRQAVWTLGRIRARAGVPVMRDALASDAALMRMTGARALGDTGPLAHGALPALRHAAADEDAAVRSAVAIAFGKIGDADAVATLAAMLDDASFTVRFPAARVLVRLGKPARDVIRAHLTHGSARARYALLTELDRTAAKRLRPEIRAAAAHASWPIRARALALLSKIDADAYAYILERGDAHPGLHNALRPES